METYLQPWKKYAQFSGRASRKEYWTFTLVNLAVMIFFLVANAFVSFLMIKVNVRDPGPTPEMDPVQSLLMIVFAVFMLATFLPGLAVGVRRLHDTGRSGWWMLISLVYLIGGIVLLVFQLQQGDTFENQYGPDPYDGENSPYLSIAPPPPGAYTDLSA